VTIFRRLLDALAPEGPAEYSDWDLRSRALSRDEADASPALAAPEDVEGGGRVRCPRCDTWYGLDEGHTCPPPQSPYAVLAVAFPAHGLVLTGEQADALIDDIALRDALVNRVAPLMAHSRAIRARRLGWIESGLRGVA
jgi:hypothetical protein